MHICTLAIIIGADKFPTTATVRELLTDMYRSSKQKSDRHATMTGIKQARLLRYDS
jgi:hypothetical protein